MNKKYVVRLSEEERMVCQNRAYQSPGTRLKQSTYPKRRTAAVNLPVAGVMHQPETLNFSVFVAA